MKRFLLIIRHAEAQNGPIDHERKLSDFGIEQAKKLGIALQTKAGILDEACWLVSSAKRTQETFYHLADSYPSKTSLNQKTVGELYNQYCDGILEVLFSQEKSLNAIAMIAHNPGVSELASYLTGEMVGFKTAKALLLSIESDDWTGLTAGSMNVEAEF